jgi:predicted metal-dependent HD superfamily phosphohydrolase
MTRMDLHDRFDRAWSGCAAGVKQLFDELVARYSEPHRAYHTLQHVEECLAAVEPALHLAKRPHEVEIAIWFHDAVHDPRARDNEERSADWLRDALERGEAKRRDIERLQELVRATRHPDAAPADPDARLVVDADLAILGADEARFAEYEAQIRREYDWVPEERFRLERARVLGRFLARPNVYCTGWFRDRREARARANLTRALGGEV